MNKVLLSALFATVAMPMVAFAQTETPADDPATEMQTEAPAESTGDAPSTDSEMAPATDEPASGGDAMDSGASSGADSNMESSDMESGDMESGDSGSTMAEPASEGSETLAGADAVEGPFVTVPQTGAWRTSDLDGKSVEDANGESIGDISDVLVNEEGEVIAVLVGVGGFLGIGEKDVAVSMSALEFGPGKTEGLKTEDEVQAEQAAPAETGVMTGETANGMTATAPATDTAAATPAAPEEPVVGEDNLPDRIVLNVTREELEAAPAYGDVEEGVTGGGDDSATMETETEAPAE